MALLKLTDKYPPQRWKPPAAKLFFHGIPKSQKHTVHTAFRTDKLPEQEVEKSSTSQYGFTRGAGYYDRRTTNAD